MRDHPLPQTVDRAGLGLSIAQAIVTAHGATMDAGPGPEGGLSVSISFPAAGPGPSG